MRDRKKSQYYDNDHTCKRLQDHKKKDKPQQAEQVIDAFSPGDRSPVHKKIVACDQQAQHDLHRKTDVAHK